jgi:hypothetical protein
MSNPSDTVAELHAELKSALRAIENAEDTFKAAVEAVQTAVTGAKDKLQDIAFRLHELAPPTVAAEALYDLQAKPRLTRALAVRDHLVPLIYADGRIQGGDLPFMGLKIGPYQMALNTPKGPKRQQVAWPRMGRRWEGRGQRIPGRRMVRGSSGASQQNAHLARLRKAKAAAARAGH